MDHEQRALRREEPRQPERPAARRRAGREYEVGESDAFLAVPDVPDIDSMLSGIGRMKHAEVTVDRLAPGGVLCVLFRDVNFGGPRLAVPSESGVVQNDGSVLIELDGYWRGNLTAIQPGTMSYWKAELVPRVAHLPRRLVRLPMSMTPDGYNDLIGALRLVR
ncbi:hypothetical protein [Kineosporia sp. NBRC 101731]|uniref:hypothetical protein n=1 Tax=Kineosporia sp. NBRC 101731 TaxID=3032199 RepID=UPI0024A21AD7|nr:hypothetical protein [Kineosporia sp. NBRC 101731]GLY33064.1 hypothetical protein Kisp02_64290 [Kineosporia sp. NBRC 101731]